MQENQFILQEWNEWEINWTNDTVRNVYFPGEFS